MSRKRASTKRQILALVALNPGKAANGLCRLTEERVPFLKVVALLRELVGEGLVTEYEDFDEAHGKPCFRYRVAV